MNNKITFSSYLAIGFMLFALFFGAGNLIFPAQLGQYAGSNIWPAIIGFLVTGVGLPLLGILAMGFSGSRNLQELSSRVHPVYGIFFTALLYLTIGPFFAAPRTGTVAYEVGIAPFISEGAQQTGLLVFTILFFAVALLFSLYPGKIVNNVGKILAPALVVLLVILLLVAIFNPMGAMQNPQEAYQGGAFVTGFLEGYNTMDALASLVFGIIVINAIRALGITSKSGILSATARTGVIAITLLGIIYVGIAILGATSTETLGLFDTGGPVLSGAASHYFGTFGSIMLAIMIILACLTTAIGLITANAEYFNTLFPKLSYKVLVVFFSVLTFVVANFGLANIITFSIPVLMFLYPLAIVLMLLTFVSPLFNHARMVYVAAIAVTFLISIFDGLVALCDSLGIDNFSWMNPVLNFYESVLPFYNQGLGWLLPAAIVIIITGIIAKVVNVGSTQEV
ncbi:MULTISPECIES: branched-chain amino acid transport system II carrier protein [Oceanobacillus]|uniref:Branched-chain amino acid transport system carrier protein n=1 Tax=Oceanobacillus profundus TaxID=372463 RepID=A0A417YII2_9BACI|nr:branched-chain amino acid transport system II carrier protein [Oceanobacillus profundus]MCM3400108.1 branched-chain amino acid transport system II carrier protein [Oceanobacillus profundus]PAE28299.1 branched-chain amino acid transport system II carrier protein [Paenibacillus sp. 7884-2]RHW32669.1 branched-chain amino acid transport system II carrier protein [Oceanobacillus profundus]